MTGRHAALFISALAAAVGAAVALTRRTSLGAAPLAQDLVRLGHRQLRPDVPAELRLDHRICHNLCVLVQAIFEFGLEPKFWVPAPANDTQKVDPKSAPTVMADLQSAG